VVAGCLAVLGLAGIVIGAGPAFKSTTTVGAASGDLYFTTYKPGTVDKVSYSLNRGALSLSPVTVVTQLPGADGIVFASDGRLLVGAGNGTVFAVDPSSGEATSVKAGTGAFMLALSPDGKTLYTGGLPGPLSAIVLAPLGPGHLTVLSGDDARISGLAFGPDGRALYTSSDPGGRGDIGIVNLRTGLTRRLFQNVPGAHGVVYDPYTDTYILSGGSTVQQLSAVDPSQVVSQTTLPITSIDQGAVDGHGHALMASNGGSLIYIDYSATKRVGDLADHVSIKHLATHLDDVAPLIGPGARPTPTLAHLWTDGGVGALVLAGLAGAGYAVTVRRRRRPTLARRLPRWDVRRQQAARQTDDDSV